MQSALTVPAFAPTVHVVERTSAGVHVTWQINGTGRRLSIAEASRRLWNDHRPAGREGLTTLLASHDTRVDFEIRDFTGAVTERACANIYGWSTLEQWRIRRASLVRTAA